MTPEDKLVRSTRAGTDLARMKRTRRHPRPTQWDYLHLKRLLGDLGEALAAVPAPVNDAVDVFCGTRPYDDLFPESARLVGYDIDDHYGAADVASPDFLPFDDSSFDLLTCIEGFHYIPDPEHGIAEFKRVLRPGGTALLTVPFVWEYDRSILEHRFTGPELAALFEGWDGVEVVENGGRAVSWATLTGRLIVLAQSSLPSPLRVLSWPLFALGYLGANAVGAVVDSIERRLVSADETLPMNLLVVARRPAD